MAASLLAVVAVQAASNPVEVQTWLAAHTTNTILTMWNNDTTFYILYQ